MLTESVTVSAWAANCYIVGAADSSECVVIDPGISGQPAIEQRLRELGRTPVAVIGTHGHLDHIGDAAKVAERFDVGVYLHPADFEMLTNPAAGLGEAVIPALRRMLGSEFLPAPAQVLELIPGERLEVAGCQFDISYAPGHTLGSVLLTEARAKQVFTGDVLFAGAVGRVDLPGGSASQMVQTLTEVIASLDPDLTALPGHGPATTVAHELATNPYLLSPQLLER